MVIPPSEAQLILWQRTQQRAAAVQHLFVDGESLDDALASGPGCMKGDGRPSDPNGFVVLTKSGYVYSDSLEQHRVAYADIATVRRSWRPVSPEFTIALSSGKILRYITPHIFGREWEQAIRQVVRSPSPTELPIDRRLRLVSGAMAAVAAVFNLIALFPSYSYVGADAARVTLHDSPASLVYNLVLVGALLIAAALVLVGKTARLGLGMVVGCGFLFLTLFVVDVGDVLRGTAAGTSSYDSPGAGFYLGAAWAAASMGAACVATTALRRSGDLAPVRTRTTGTWAAAGLILAGAWLLGDWWPWSRDVLTYISRGTPQTYDFAPCCSLSQQPGQRVVQALTFTALVAAIGVLAACISSSALAAGLYLSAAVCAVAPCVTVLLKRPFTLEQVANAFHWSLPSLTSANSMVRVEVLPGVWIAALASAGLLLMAVVRGLQPELLPPNVLGRPFDQPAASAGSPS
ncbi:hypothetical protein [Catenulispora rubra]|uniref:hypothetical protein n=1 Tax=Catenulispora rubra TaxID=280293 RepID=UPI00189263E4|nr:hypothetical protein [Catenulispora rubra]